jgi:hypothetical protein
MGHVHAGREGRHRRDAQGTNQATSASCQRHIRPTR